MFLDQAAQLLHLLAYFELKGDDIPFAGERTQRVTSQTMEIIVRGRADAARDSQCSQLILVLVATRHAWSIDSIDEADIVHV